MTDETDVLTSEQVEAEQGMIPGSDDLTEDELHTGIDVSALLEGVEVDDEGPRFDEPSSQDQDDMTLPLEWDDDEENPPCS